MMDLLKSQLSDPHHALVVTKSGGHKAHPDKKTSWGKRETV